LHHVLAQLRLTRQHFGGRIPIGPFLLAMDGRKPGPDETFRADAHAIANGLSAALDEVEKMVARIDNDRARALACGEGDNRAGEGGIGPSWHFRRHGVNAGIGRPACKGGKRQQHGAYHTLRGPHSSAAQFTEPYPHRGILNQKRRNEHPLVSVGTEPAHKGHVAF